MESRPVASAFLPSTAPLPLGCIFPAEPVAARLGTAKCGFSSSVFEVEAPNASRPASALPEGMADWLLGERTCTAAPEALWPFSAAAEACCAASAPALG